MAVLEGKTPTERNKLIAVIVLGALAIFILGRTFFGSSSPPNKTRRPGSAVTRQNAGGSTLKVASQNASSGATEESLMLLQPVEYSPVPPPVPEAKRNVFAYYTPPVSPSPANAASPAVPTPMPSPSAVPASLILASVSPSSTYANTGELALEVSGDKFTSETRIFVDGQELPTRFTSAQRLTTAVPATLTASAGARQIVVRTPDNQLFSNAMTLNVAAPPTPSYTYVGLLGGSHYNDTAVLMDQRGEIHNVQRGDIVGGRFRVTSISERAIDFLDTQLRIKHTLPYTEARSSSGVSGASPVNPVSNRNPAQRSSPPRPPRAVDDDAP